MLFGFGQKSHKAAGLKLVRCGVVIGVCVYRLVLVNTMSQTVDQMGLGRDRLALVMADMMWFCGYCSVWSS